MFEYDQEIVEKLLVEDINFRRLYDKHHDLKARVSEANVGAAPIDDASLETMKKRKLHLKDQMATLIEEYRQAHV